MSLRYANTERPFNSCVPGTEVTAVNTTDKVSIDTERGERTISKSSRPQKHNVGRGGQEWKRNLLLSLAVITQQILTCLLSARHFQGQLTRPGPCPPGGGSKPKKWLCSILKTPSIMGKWEAGCGRAGASGSAGCNSQTRASSEDTWPAAPGSTTGQSSALLAGVTWGCWPHPKPRLETQLVWNSRSWGP